ncbi:YfiT family bacillithiol transferase [Flavobacterium sp. U410]
MNTIHIEKYRPDWKFYFEQFNRAWIEKYFVLEDIDKYVLSNPEEAILKDGGKILFAVYEGKVIGTVALKKVDDETMELTKMAVDENYQSIGAGKMLCKSAIDKAKDLNVKRLVLYTQSALKPALGIYKKLGFTEVPVEQGKYKRADIKMEMILKDNLLNNQYPTGKYKKPEVITEEMCISFIDTIASFPKNLKSAIMSLNDKQLDTPYRNGSWTVRQVVHHLADSNINCFARIKFALTEDNPTIKPFVEEKWAELSDAKHISILPSLSILEGIHERWVILLKGLEKQDWDRTFFHPDLNKSQTVAEAMAKYSWHCNHHLAQIKNLKNQMLWK